jgi:enoyl-[acyl-carrier protein] reductase I
MLAGKRILITGVATRHSIAYAAAEQAQRAGAEVVLTSFGRMRRMTERAARSLPATPDVLELDVRNPDDFERVREDLEERWGGLDGALHAIAFAPEDAIGGRFLDTPPASASAAFETSAFSFKSLGRALLPLLEAGDAPGGSLVGLDFDASVAWPAYDWMGVSKAALEAVSRYMARDLGPRGVRVNLVSAGPLDTPAAGGIPGFGQLAGAWSARAPLGWDTGDASPVGAAICFLLSDLARAVTGEILHVDGGFHAMGVEPAAPAPAPAEQESTENGVPLSPAASPPTG